MVLGCPLLAESGPLLEVDLEWKSTHYNRYKFKQATAWFVVGHACCFSGLLLSLNPQSLENGEIGPLMGTGGYSQEHI